MDAAFLQTVAGIVAFAVGVVVAGLVLFVAPARTQNRLLATALLFEATAMLTFGVIGLVEEPATVAALLSVNLLMASLVACLYPAFLGTLDSPLARPFAKPTAVGGLVALASVIFVAWPFLRPADSRFVLWPLAAVMLYGILVASTSLARARTALTRRRSFAVLFAFGLRDALTIPLLLGLLAEVHLRGALFALASLASFVILGYAVLALQLFDVDLRLKRTLRHGTVAAAFLAAFFVASELAAALLADHLGTVAGIVAAGLLVFFLAPLQRAAERVADHAMPRTTETPAYAVFRRLEIYKATVEEIMADGRVTEKERRTLDLLRAKLAIDPADAAAIERDHAGMVPALAAR